MAKLWKVNIWWGNDTFIKPSSAKFDETINNNNSIDYTPLNIVWDTYNRGTIQLKQDNKELFTYLEDEGNFYFLYPRSTANKSKTVLVYEVIPDVWKNHLLDNTIYGILELTSNESKILNNDYLVKQNKEYIKTIDSVGNQELTVASKEIFEKIEYWSDSIGRVSLLKTQHSYRGLHKVIVKKQAFKLNSFFNGATLPDEYKNYYCIGELIENITSNNPEEVISFNITTNKWFFKYNSFGEKLEIAYPAIVKGLNALKTFNLNYYTTVLLNGCWWDALGQYWDSGTSFLLTRDPFKTFYKGQEFSWTNNNSFYAYIPTIGYYGNYGYCQTFRQSDVLDFKVLKYNQKYNSIHTNPEAPRIVNGKLNTFLATWYTNLDNGEYLRGFSGRFIILKKNNKLYYLTHRDNITFKNRTPEDNQKVNVSQLATNEVGYGLEFQDGTNIKYPVGETNGTIQVVIKDNSVINNIDIRTPEWNYLDTKEFPIDSVNFYDLQLKRRQLDLLQRENNFTNLNFAIEQKRADEQQRNAGWNLALSLIGGVAGVGLSAAQGAVNPVGAVAGVTSSLTGIAGNINSYVSQTTNYKYDNQIRTAQRHLSVASYNYKRDLLNNEIRKLDPQLNSVSAWTEKLKFFKVGQDGFLRVKYTATERARKLYQAYLANVGYETKDLEFRHHRLDEPGIYKFSEFEEWSPYNGDEIKQILTNPILIK